jgi:hypothetical protein
LLNGERLSAHKQQLPPSITVGKCGSSHRILVAQNTGPMVLTIGPFFPKRAVVTFEPVFSLRHYEVTFSCRVEPRANYFSSRLVFLTVLEREKPNAPCTKTAV